ncbi:hypothetical protein [Rubrivirga sp. IMCC45206]|uniref:hypothetical protein n=1 Tax=Rubrivirga sp. IMCC45206 TaxID=3391614 RepID=UPI00398FB59D
MRSPALALAALLAVSLAACDAASPATSTATAVTLDAQALDGADIYYDLEPLALGETFTATLETGGDPFTLRSTRTASGYVDTFIPPAGVERVRVSYEFDGVEVAEAWIADSPGVIESGVADDEGTSWHWQRDSDGTIRLAKDNKKTSTEPAIDGPGALYGTLYTTPSGERVRVTHVWFEMIGAKDIEPETIRFETPRGFEIATADLKRR